MDRDQAAQRRLFRLRIFASTWVCYAGLYFCRHAFFVAKGDLTQTLGLDAGQLAVIGMIYLVAYSLGEFNAAALGTRFGARRLLLAGMAVSLGANVVFGFANNFWTFAAFMAFNGLAQATGWSGTVGTMAHWFSRRERGQVMGLWSTCYQVGGAVAKGFAAFMIGWLGWRWSFWGASLVLGVVWLLFFVLQRNRPEDVGLPAIVDPEERSGHHDQGAGHPATAAGGFSASLLVTILMMGSFYLFVKFIRYALWSWAPYFLKLNFLLPSDQAGYVSTIFDIAGFFGVIVAGVLSDRLFKGRRAGLALVMIVGLALGTLLLWRLGAHDLTAFAVCIGLIGFCLYGPDSLISGAGAIDVGSRRYALAAAGMINGMGSIGPIIQEAVIGSMYQDNPTELAPILGVLSLSAGLATLLMALLLLRARQGKCNL